MRECKKSYTHIWDQDKMFGATSENFVGEQAMQEEIMKNGSIEGMMTVFDDLYAYKSGVYKHVTGGICGVHCIKIVGWGVEDGFVSLFLMSLRQTCVLFLFLLYEQCEVLDHC